MVLLLAVSAGSALGALTIPLAVLSPGWVGHLFTEAAAGWCAVVVLSGVWAGTRSRPWQVALFGAVALLVAVVCYYATGAILAGGPDFLLTPAEWLLPAWLWLLAACAAGPLLTTVGAWIRHERRPRRVVGLGLLGGVFLADALLPLLDWTYLRVTAPEVPVPSSLAPMYLQSAFLASVGVALVLAVAREPGDRVRGLAAMVPAGLLWYAGVWGAHRVMFLAGMGFPG